MVHAGSTIAQEAEGNQWEQGNETPSLHLGDAARPQGKAKGSRESRLKAMPLPGTLRWDPGHRGMIWSDSGQADGKAGNWEGRRVGSGFPFPLPLPLPLPTTPLAWSLCPAQQRVNGLPNAHAIQGGEERERQWVLPFYSRVIGMIHSGPRGLGVEPG